MDQAPVVFQKPKKKDPYETDPEHGYRRAVESMRYVLGSFALY